MAQRECVYTEHAQALWNREELMLNQSWHTLYHKYQVTSEAPCSINLIFNVMHKATPFS